MQQYELTGEESLDSLEVQKQLKRILQEVRQHGTPTIIEEDGEQVAAIISIDVLRKLQRDEDFRVFEEISQRFMDEPLEKLEAEIADAVREVREERYRKTQSATSDQ